MVLRTSIINYATLLHSYLFSTLFMKFPILNLRDEINAELEGAIGF